MSDAEREGRKAMTCLRLEMPESICADVEAKVLAWVAAAEARGVALAMAQVRRMAEKRIAEWQEAEKTNATPNWAAGGAAALSSFVAALPATPDLAAEVRRIEERAAAKERARALKILWERSAAVGDHISVHLDEAADLIEGGAE